MSSASKTLVGNSSGGYRPPHIASPKNGKGSLPPPEDEPHHRLGEFCVCGAFKQINCFVTGPYCFVAEFTHLRKCRNIVTVKDSIGVRLLDRVNYDSGL